MKLTISSIANAGEIAKERVILKADQDLDLTYFALFSCRASPNGYYAGEVPLAYWFSPKKISANDFVILYTKQGISSEKENPSGSTSHFFYWKKSETIWSPERRAVVVSTPEWRSADIQPDE